MESFEKLLARAQRERAKVNALRRSCANDDAAVSAAASALGCLPKALVKGRRRIPRQWTGFIAGERCWVGRKVVLPDGTVGLIKKVTDGNALITSFNPKDGLEENRFVHASNLRLFRSPEAMLLGARKRGKQERPSLKKAASSKLNGSCPVRPGRRPRGRPRKPVVTAQPLEKSTESVLSEFQELRALLRSMSDSSPSV